MGKKGRFVQAATQCQLTPWTTTTTTGMSTHHPMAPSQCDPGLALVFCLGAAQLWQVVLRADVIFACCRYSKPSLTHLGPGDRCMG